jgi:hypothetical protein
VTCILLALLFAPAIFLFGPRFYLWLEAEIERAFAEWSELLSRDPETPKFVEWWAHRKDGSK